MEKLTVDEYLERYKDNPALWFKEQCKTKLPFFSWMNITNCFVNKPIKRKILNITHPKTIAGFKGTVLYDESCYFNNKPIKDIDIFKDL